MCSGFAAVAAPRRIRTGVVAIAAASLLDNATETDLRERRNAAPHQLPPFIRER